MGVEYDFQGWATRNNIKCSDGRIIRRDAFIGNNGATVPLVWNHQHNDADCVLGHALLENRDDGVYAYCKLNNTIQGRNAKEYVKNGDVVALSIYANQLKQNGSDVIHGNIRELSLVLAGANPGAYIESVMCHDDLSDEAAYIQFVDEPEEKLEHADAEDNKEEPKKEDKPVAEETKTENTGKTVGDVWKTFTEEQKKVVYALIGAAVEEANKKGDNKEDMKHNAFDGNNETRQDVLSHSDIEEIFSDAKRMGSLKDSVLAHTDGYGIENIDYLFPDAKTLTNEPEFVRRDTGWVNTVMNGVHRSPFSRIKSIFANITEADARARGYIKGNFKKEEVFSLLKRTTTPTTIYKKQKLDRDDVIDMDLDGVSFVKKEMRGMLDEEIARAALFGDGRSAGSDDKINEQCIRPVWTDEDFFTIKYAIPVASTSSSDVVAKAFIRAAVKARKQYKGSGNPVLFTTEDMLTDCLLLEDTIGHKLYKTEAELATAMRVSKIVTVEVMEGLSRNDNGTTKYLWGLILNMNDYNIGADKGGQVGMFDDFDLDFNQMKYLIETRCSGALTKPYSAIALEGTYAAIIDVEPDDPTDTVLGKTVSDLQEDIIVNGDYIEGVLPYVTGYTGYSGDPEEQKGNYLVLKFTATEGATTKIKMDGSPVGEQTLDSDMLAVFRITNKRTNKITVTSEVNGIKVVKHLSLAGLKLEQP